MLFSLRLSSAFLVALFKSKMQKLLSLLKARPELVPHYFRCFLVKAGQGASLDQRKEIPSLSLCF